MFSSPPSAFDEVQQRELEAIASRRKKWCSKGDARDSEPTPQSVRGSSFGICFSGGGIRSATFNLGVLQGLAKAGLLPLADYLSTVSGGGYIGGWFHALLKRKAWSNARLSRSYSSVEDYLAEETRHPDPAENDPITFLRQFSNYLAPQLGLLSADAWVILSIWARNTILNQIIFVLSLAGALLAPLLVGNLAEAAPRITSTTHSWWACGGVVALLLLWVVWRMSRNLKSVVKREFIEKAHRHLHADVAPDSDVSAWWSLAAPVFIAALLLSFLCASGRFDPLRHLPTGVGLAIGLLVLFWSSLWHGGFPICFEKRHPRERSATRNFIQKALGFTIIVVCTGGTWGLLAGAGHLLPPAGHGLDVWQCMAWGPPLFVLALSGGVMLQIGLMGVDYPDSAREWYARLGATLLIVSAVWILLFTLSVFVPLLVIWFFVAYTKTGIGGVATWLATTFAGLKAANSPATSGDPTPNAATTPPNAPRRRNAVLEVIARAAPPLAIAGFLIAISTASFYTIEKVWPRHSTVNQPMEVKPEPSLRVSAQGSGGVALHWNSADRPGFWETLRADSHDYSALHLSVNQNAELFGSALFLLVTALVLSARFNINEFSMNHFYKNRLVRCYLGASHDDAGRKPNPFTGFDPHDDIPLAELVPGADYDAPYAIINCALNLNHGKELAWQERKACSFVFTPLFCGYEPASAGNKNGYVQTGEFTSHGGPHIGLATAISGAAASPNWGYHTSPVTAFLMALFNIRMGWWIGNTKQAKYARAFGPSVALKYLFAEMFGLTDEDSHFINLSDGGHFENLGLYELVRRKCRFIIVGDGEQDQNYNFESLGGAIRKARIDFGAEITISPKRIFVKDGISSVHCATGGIVYADGSHGKLFYLKASLTGDEPYDVEQYKKGHGGFPHESTMNQFFTESQFESYRALGCHTVAMAFEKIAPPQSHADLPQVFRDLHNTWLPPAGL